MMRRTDGARRKVSGKPGWKHSDEAKAKIRSAKLGRKRPDMVGHKNIAWNGGIRIDRGRVTVRTESGKYEYRSRLIAQSILGRKLLSCEEVHHKNEVKHDDNPENLQVITTTDHARLHSRSRRRDSSGRFL
jgi:hypothetical protein